MQEAFFGGWARESHLSAQALGSLRDLNHRFLDLCAARHGLRDGGVSAAFCMRLAPLSAAQRSAAAECPYALFDLRFQDDRHWQARLHEAAFWTVADEAAGPAPLDGDLADFTRLALFYAWHVAACGTLKAQLLLGMNESTASALRRATLNQLPWLAAGEIRHLSARFSHCGAFWDALAEAASSADSTALRRVQLYGLQIAAASGFAAP